MNTVTVLSLGRVAIGVASFARPHDTARALQLDPTSNPQLPFLVRLFGAREVALGAVTLAASGKARTALVMAGMAVDAADAVTGYLAQQERTVPPAAATLMTGVAGSAVVGGLLGLRVRRAVVVEPA